MSELCFLLSQPALFPQLLVNRSKRKRRRRADKALTGSEKVKVINMRTGKKVKHAVNLYQTPDGLVLNDLSNKPTNISPP